MTREIQSRLRQMIQDRESGHSQTREEFDRAREDDASMSHENAHLRTEGEIDRSGSGMNPANLDRSEFRPQLAKTGQLGARFDLAREDDASKSHMLHRTEPERVDESQMVKDSAPNPEPKPPKEVEQAVKRESFAKRWAAEIERHSEKSERNVQDDRDISREQEVEHTRDRER